MASSSFAVEMDTAEMTAMTAGGGDFEYTITLENTGTENTGTFWYSWVPGQGYLPAQPTNIVSPTGWTANITDGPVSSNGYSIQWVASSNVLTPGSSLTFRFEVAATPATLAGDSTIHPGIPVGTSEVYSGTPFSGSSDQFVVDSVPEPSGVALVVVVGLGICWSARRRYKPGLRKEVSI